MDDDAHASANADSAQLSECEAPNLQAKRALPATKEDFEVSSNFVDRNGAEGDFTAVSRDVLGSA